MQVQLCVCVRTMLNEKISREVTVNELSNIQIVSLDLMNFSSLSSVRKVLNRDHRRRMVSCHIGGGGLPLCGDAIGSVFWEDMIFQYVCNP